ncbi:hypothetical protein VCHC33A2_2956, partial [Vibrio cholerae HC-33A2]
MMVFYR